MRCVVCGFIGAKEFSLKHPCCSNCWNDPKQRKKFEKSLKKHHPESIDSYKELKKQEKK